MVHVFINSSGDYILYILELYNIYTYIPKKNVKCEFQPPWYDSNCDRVLRDKEKWREKADESGNESDLENVRQYRKDFKRSMNEKMRVSVEDDSDSALISKTSWTHVK